MPAISRHKQPASGQGGTVRVEGQEIGGPVSFFLVDAAPGQGPKLHVHPYAETWIIRKGEAEFTVGEERTRGAAGDVIVGPANIPHRFMNVGDDRLEIVCIHPSATIQQSLVEAPGQARC